MRFRRPLLAVLSAFFALFALTMVVAASPQPINVASYDDQSFAPSQGTLTGTVAVSQTVSGFALVGDIGNEGSETFTFVFTTTVPLNAANVSFVPGTYFSSQCSGGTAYVADVRGSGSPETPGGIEINFSCTAKPANAPAPAPANDVLFGTFTIANCPQNNLPINLIGTPDREYASISNATTGEYFFTNADLTDGLACAVPTAVEVGSLDAASGTSSAALIALATGTALAVVAGLVVVARRRRA